MNRRIAKKIAKEFQTDKYALRYSIPQVYQALLKTVGGAKVPPFKVLQANAEATARARQPELFAAYDKAVRQPANAPPSQPMKPLPKALVSLVARTFPELKDIAKGLGLKGYSTLKKADLIALIETEGKR